MRPPTLLAQQDHIVDALAELERGELVELVRFLLEHYVAGAAPALPRPDSVEGELAALARLPFPQLIAQLQLRCGQPELAALRVDGSVVLARVAQGFVPLQTEGLGGEALTAPASVGAPGQGRVAGVERSSSAGASPAATSGAATQAAVAGAAARPGAGAAAAAVATSPPGAAAPSATPSPPSSVLGTGAGAGKPSEDGGGPEAAERFRLLELD